MDGTRHPGRLIAGTAEGMTAPVRTHSPLFYMHLEMADQARRSVPADHEERAIYVAHGAVDVAGQRLAAGSMAVLTPATTVEIVAATGSAGLMVLGGAPIGERFLFWNFVSSSRDRIEQAKEDWRMQRMQLPDGDSAEFTPCRDVRRRLNPRRDESGDPRHPRLAADLWVVPSTRTASR